MTGNHPTKRIESQIWLKVISQQTRNDVLKISICLATSIWGNSICLNMAISHPFFLKLWRLLHIFLPKKTALCTIRTGVIFVFAISV
jgi:hypothetical protein